MQILDVLAQRKFISAGCHMIKKYVIIWLNSTTYFLTQK